MIKLLEGLDNNFYDSNRFDISTENFEAVFESLIRDEFGNEDQSKYNPKTLWHIKNNLGEYKEIPAGTLRPDVILKYRDKIYVIDAKYYTYGYAEGYSGLPEAQSIHKQITYAEDLDFNKDKIDGEISEIYNIFMLPYNNEQKFIDYVGYADVSWKSGNKPYEKVYAFTVDLKSLINQKYNKTLSKRIFVDEVENIKLC